MATNNSSITNERYCQFYLKKKNRFCRIQPKVNQIYCPEHGCVMGVQEDRKRIPCPLNSKHNCFEDDLQNHLKKCYVTKSRQAMEKQPYFMKDINKGSQDDCKNDTESTMGSVKDLTSEKLGAMIEKVNKLYTGHVEVIEKLYLEHPTVKKQVVGSVNLDLNEAFGDQTVLRKEMLQQASLVGQLHDLDFLSSGHHFVELGAGKGKLSYWIHKGCQECADNSFLLVERSSARYKVDPYYKGKGKEGTFQRIKIDIQDLCLGQVPGIQDKPCVVVVGKHLCGGATDLGIRCAVNTLTTSSQHVNVSVDSASQCTASSESSFSCSKSSNKLGEFHNENVAGDEVKKNICVQGEHLVKEKHQNCDNSSQPAEENSNSLSSSSVSEEIVEPSAKMMRLEDGYKSHLKGIMIALCCHHRCTWDTYVGQEFMRKHGVNEEEFDLLTRLSSWATCARTRIKGKTSEKEDKDNAADSKENDSKDNAADSKENDSKDNAADSKENDSKDNAADSKETDSKDKTSDKSRRQDERDVGEEEHIVEDLITSALDAGMNLREQLSISDRESIGRKCKRIIDMGRLDYLRRKDMNCCLREYIHDDITPENIVLIATNANKSISH